MVYPRLCVAYFTLFAIWGAWAGALGGYGAELKLPGWQIGWLYSAIPLGAIIAPLFIGPIADRFFPAQIISGVLHLFGGLCLLGCGWMCVGATPEAQPNFAVLATLMILSGTCFMPTIALINSIVFKHLPNASSAPYVFVFGTAGWIIVNLFIDFVCGGAKNPNFFFVGGGLSIFLAIYCMTLPHTPPKGAPAPGEKSDALGLGALKLFEDRNFLIFVVCVFLIGIPACNYYFPAMVPYLTDSGYKYPLSLTTINQFSELAFMALLPICITRFGLKNVLLLGMGAWAVRYFLFMVPALAIPGLLLHGLAYAFFYVAAYTYADKKSPPELKASVQCFMVFLLLGVGQVLGGQLYGFTSDTLVKQVGEETVKNWPMIFGIPAVFFTVMTVVFFVLGKDPEEKKEEEK